MTSKIFTGFIFFTSYLHVLARLFLRAFYDTARTEINISFFLLKDEQINKIKSDTSPKGDT